jgi:hypothetical protein
MTMPGEKKGARTAAEEIEEEITEAETEVTGGDEGSGYGRSGDAMRPGTDAQVQSQGEDDEDGGDAGR